MLATRRLKWPDCFEPIPEFFHTRYEDFSNVELVAKFDCHVASFRTCSSITEESLTLEI